MALPLKLDELDEQLSALPSDRPFGVLEAGERGAGVHRLRRLVASGRLQRPLRGVLHHAALTDTLELRIAVLRVVVPPDCVVTDRTAAWLWGATTALAPGDHEVVPRVCVFAPPGRRLRNGLCNSGERELSRSDVVELEGLLVTTPLRTACDLARLLHRDQALAALDALSAVGSLSIDRLTNELDRFKGYRGVVQARTLVPLTDPRSQSPGESALRLRWHDARLPHPECQVEVPAPRGSYFIDVGLPDEQFGAEYDGEDFHGPEEKQHDDGRRSWIRGVEEWELLVFRRAHVFGRLQDADRQLGSAWRARSQ